MSDNLSANALLHFTENSENLINVLKNGFYPRCCAENLEFIYKKEIRENIKTGFSIPMICFCDIPLSQISNHVKKYGGYAIGLSKEWGEENGINPVMYELPNSNAIEAIRESINITMQYLTCQSSDNQDYQEEMRRLGNELIFFACYLKPYKGKMWDGKEFSGDEVILYDEKEWRYIPSYREILEKSIKPFLLSHEFVDEKKKKQLNELFKQHFNLTFKTKDIKYIIVEKESDVLNMANMIEEIKSHYSQDEIKLLISRIISVERLKNDF